MSMLALDIGGANIKMVHEGEPDGLLTARTVPFELWKSPERLADQLKTIAGSVPDFKKIVFTTTAELCDCFATKREGIRAVVDSVDSIAERRPVHIWSTHGRFLNPSEANLDPIASAAANWHALATFAAGLIPEGDSILVDTGSTTTDIIRLSHGRPQCRGLTDPDRLASGELVYVGRTRTPLCSLGPSVNFASRSFGVMAEFFATTEDTAVLTGRRREDPDQTGTADGRPLMKNFCAARVLRMIGSDLELSSVQDAESLAKSFETMARNRIAESIRRMAEGLSAPKLLISGSGAQLAAEAAAMALPDAPQSRLSDLIGPEASVAACAYALIQLAKHP